MNVIKDEVFGGRILDMIEKTLAFVKGQIKERKFLGSDGKFVTIEEYPEFVWKELIVNAVAHRDYSIKGTDIQIKMFDDRICVESPGTLPSIVRLNNMREMPFSRNPKIAEFLHEYNYVQEFGEGVDRIYREMSAAGLPNPEYSLNSFILSATVRNGVTESVADNVADKNTESVIRFIKEKPDITLTELSRKVGVTRRTVDRIILKLKAQGRMERVGSDRKGYWKIK